MVLYGLQHGCCVRTVGLIFNSNNRCKRHLLQVSVVQVSVVQVSVVPLNPTMLQSTIFVVVFRTRHQTGALGKDGKL